MTDPIEDLKAQAASLRKISALDAMSDQIRSALGPYASPLWSSGPTSGLLESSPYYTPLSLASIPTWAPLSIDASAQLEAHDKERAALRKLVSEQRHALQQGSVAAEEKERRIAALEGSLIQLQEKERLGHILSSVNDRARELLLTNATFRQRFLDADHCVAFVMSVDIRRSTELMLKARSAQQFAAFLAALTSELLVVITRHYGVFDKFTGDGVLAYFPDFYTGAHAADWALHAASACHDVFTRLYRASWGSFVSVLKDVGLGIGIDHGSVHLVRVAGGLTVVGVPVVYACRLSAAPAGTTLLNQSSYDDVRAHAKGLYELRECEIDVKHEGRMVAYSASLRDGSEMPPPPSWALEEPAAAPIGASGP